MDLHGESQQTVDSQSQTQTEPQSIHNSLKIKPVNKYLWLLIIAVSIILVAAGYGSNFFTRPRQTQHIVLHTPSEPIKLSLIYSLDKAHLQDHDYDTLINDSTQTYISDLSRQNTKTISIGYDYKNNIDTNTSLFQTTPNGKYIIRTLYGKIEISSVDNPTNFQTISPQGDNYFISQDSTKMITKDEAEIHIIDLSDPHNIINVSPPNPEDINPIIGYDTNKHRLYIHRSSYFKYDYIDILTIDNQGNILNSKEENDYNFITEFSSDFHYAFFEDIGTQADGYPEYIYKEDLNTGRKTILATLPKGDSPVDIKLSPTQDTLSFFNNAPISGSNDWNNKLYIVNLKTNYVRIVNVPAGFTPEVKNYISPDGKYFLLYNSSTCRNDTCTTNNEQKVIYSIANNKFYLYYQPVGINEANQDEGSKTSYHNIETMTIFGWLAAPSGSKTSVSLPEFDLSPELATPTPNPLVTSSYPLMQIDLSKNKYYYSPYQYPDEILNAKPENLIGMKCSPRFACDPPYDSCWEFDPNNFGQTVTNKDPQFIKVVKEAAASIDVKQSSDSLENITICQTRSGNTIVEYQTLGNSDPKIGLADGLDYVGYAPLNENLKRVATINSQADEHACDEPIMLTNNLDFYLNCQEDQKEIMYKINLNNAGLQPVISCDRDANVCQ